MKAEERYEEILSEFDRKYLYEFVFIPIFIGLFIFSRFEMDEILSEQSRNMFAFICFGGIHLLSSRILSFLYNLNWVICPVAIKTSPRGLKILGAFVVAIVVFNLLKNYLAA